MTPEEKAKELVEMFFEVQIQDINALPRAKQCALICVYEIINTESLANRPCGYVSITKEHLQYWQEVKHNILSL